MQRYLLSILITLFSLLPVSALTPAENDSLQRIADAAERGNAAAQNTVGCWYYNGENFKQDYNKAVQWWLRSQKQDYPAASANLAICYLRGHGVKADSTRATGLMKRAIRLGDKGALSKTTAMADKGDKWAAALLADIYKNGLGSKEHRIKPDKELAAKYLKIAADGGDTASQVEVAMSLLNAKKFAEAFKIFRSAADTGNQTAMFWTGKMLLEGMGIPINKEDGLKYLRRAADAGMPMAQYYIGRSYAVGDGLTKDAATAAKWYESAAMKGNHYAQYALARALMDGEGVAKDYGRALRWFERVTGNGHPIAFSRLINDTIPNSSFADYCRVRKLVAGGSYEEALKRIKQLKKVNKAEAEVWEGIILATPEYSGHSDSKALKLFRSAAKASNSEGLYRLGLWTIEGRGMKAPDRAEGIKLLQQAAAGGNAQAALALAEIYYKGEITQRNPKLSEQYFVQAAAMMPLTKEAREHYASLYEDKESDVADPATRVAPDAGKAEAIRKATDKDMLGKMLQSVKVI